MLRLGLIGTDGGAKNGHSLLVSKVINKENDWDAKFVAVYGENQDETKDLAEVVGIDFIASDVTEMLDKVDAVFVMFRDGSKHLRYAKPFLEKGIPLFIDKPYVCSMEDVEEFLALAKEHKCILGGGSSLRYCSCVQKVKEEVGKATKIFSGTVAYPQHAESPYCGVHFYSHHVIEPMIEAFGHDVKAINITQSGDKLIGVALYEDFPVALIGACHQADIYVGAYLQRSDFLHEKFDQSNSSELLYKDFLNCVKKGEQCLDYDHIYATVKISCAMEESIKKKGLVEIEW